jgi:hypothetical protein
MEKKPLRINVKSIAAYIARKVPILHVEMDQGQAAGMSEVE